jgi:hypothetical protein
MTLPGHMAGGTIETQAEFERMYMDNIMVVLWHGKSITHGQWHQIGRE